MQTISETIDSAIQTVAFTTLIIWFLLKREGSDWPRTIKIQMFLIWVSYVSRDIRNIWMIIKGVEVGDAYDEIWALGLLTSISISTFLAMHWSFTSHYLKMACILKLKSDQGRFVIDQRFFSCTNTLILFLDIMMYSTLASFFAVSIANESLGIQLANWTSLIFFWLITIINYFSMRQITKSTRQLNMPGIVANKSLRTGFALFFLCAAISDLVNFTMFELEGSERRKQDYKSALYYRYEITHVAFNCLTNFMVMGAHAFMLVMYVNYSQKLRLTGKEHQRIADSLITC